MKTNKYPCYIYNVHLCIARVFDDHRSCQKLMNYTLPKGTLMVEVCIGTMALKNDQQYGCQTGNNLKEKSCDLNRNSSRFFFK